MRNYFYRLSVIVLFASSLLSANPVLALEIPNPLESDSFQELIIAIGDILFTIALAVVPLMIVIAGFYFLISAGDPAKVTIAKNIILYTLIGVLIMASARGLIAILQTIF